MPRLIRLQDACEQFSIPIRTGRRLVREGEIPASKPGREYLVDPADMASALRPIVRVPPPKPERETPSERERRQLREAGIAT